MGNKKAVLERLFDEAVENITAKARGEETPTQLAEERMKLLAWNRTRHADLLKKNKKTLSTFNSPVFKKACELAGIEPTKRQARKWNNKRGIARQFRNSALQQQQVA